MKKGLTLCIILLLLFSGMFLYAAPADLVVLLDTSKSVFNIFDDLVDYIIKGVLTERIRFDDTVHIITFASKPEIEISLPIKDKKDIETVLKRLFLLQALGNYTDLISSLKYLYQYVDGLPGNTQKTILILTDGVHNPPPGSRFDGANADTEKELQDSAAALSGRDWNVRIINLPDDDSGAEETSYTYIEDGPDAGLSPEAEGALPPGEKLNLFSFLPEDGSIPVTDYDENALDTITNMAFGAPKILFPPHLGKVGYRFNFPLTVSNFKDTPILFKVSGLLWNGKDILERKASEQINAKQKKEIRIWVSLPEDVTAGDQSIAVELIFPGDMASFPGYGTLSFTLAPSFTLSDSRPLLIIIIVIGGLAVLFGLFMLVLFLRRAFESLSWRPGEQVKTVYDLYKKYRSHEIRRPVEMVVENQNTKIGMRNIHILEKGSVKTVGGASSSYYIFLYPVKGHIARIEYSGERYVFTPVKEKYFPALSGPVFDCIGKPILVVSETGKEFFIHFEEYVSSLEKINRILHLPDEPGLPKDWPLPQ